MLTFKDQPDAGRVADMIGGYLTIDVPEKEKLLEAISVKERLHLLYTYLCKELEIVTLERTFPSRSVSRSNRISVNIICENR